MAAKPGKGSERVKAWIYAVVNPWSDILELEHNLLSEGSVSFRWQRGELEFVRPLRSSLARGAELILRDLARIRPEVKEWELKHDTAVECLRRSALAASAAITGGEGFRAAVMRARDATPDLARRVAKNDEQLIGWMAERALNNVGELSSDYSDADFWNQHRSDLIAARGDQKMARLDGDRALLIEVDEKTSQFLSELRESLVDEYDVPPGLWG